MKIIPVNKDNNKFYDLIIGIKGLLQGNYAKE